MASTREIRRRIRSVKSTAQITRAMQLVAAAKMHKAQEAALNGKNYARVLARVLASLSTNITPSVHKLFQEQQGEVAVLYLSSDRGLAGAFNANLIREAGQLPKEAKYITLGKKGRDFVVKTQRTLSADFPSPEGTTFSTARSIAKTVLDDFLAGNVGKVSILYTDFINTLRQQPRVIELLPIKIESFARILEAFSTKDIKEDVEAHEYLFEPKVAQLLDTVLKHFVEMTVYQAMLESNASEHSARMIAMKNATDNANELVDDLTLAYNQVRQDAITRELLEITTAAAALA